MFDFVDKISALSNYSFVVGIANSTINVSLSDESSVPSDDFLRMLENGSLLNEIIASRPIERTWLILKDMMQQEYVRCIELIVSKNVKLSVIDERMRILGIKLAAQLKMQVNASIRNDIECQVFYKGKKIN